jgi:arylsulfatase A-like enzyme
MPGAVTSREDFEHMVTGYDAAIAYVDHHIAQILEEFERQDALDDTVVIISGDHGDAFGEHGIYSDHVCADECIHHIPLIVRWPGVASGGGENYSLLYNIDFAPTLCELLDLPIPGDWDGTSFYQQLTGHPGFERDHLVWDHGLYALQRAVRTRTHLMIRTYDPLVYAFEPIELYNLVEDPYQTRNLRDEESETLAECSLLLESWIHEQRGKPHAIPDPLDEILRERAKS